MRSQVETASQTQLVLMLYDGAIRFLSLGRETMVRKDTGWVESKNHYLVKSQRIIGELMSTLDHKLPPNQGGDVAANLHRLYAYMLPRIVEANLEDKPEPLVEVIDLLRELRAGWEEVDRNSRRETRDG